MNKSKKMLVLTALLLIGNFIPAAAVNTGNGDLQFSCFRQRGYWTFKPNESYRLFAINFSIRGKDTGESESVIRVFPSGTTENVGGQTITLYRATTYSPPKPQIDLGKI